MLDCIFYKLLYCHYQQNLFWSIELSCLKRIFVVLENLRSCILFLKFNFSWSPGIIHEWKKKWNNTLKIVVEYGLNESYKKSDALIKIQAKIENKISCIESVPQFVQIWIMFLHATFSSDIVGIWGNQFHNKYSHICFANIFLVKHFLVSNFLIVINLINQSSIIYNYFLILLDQTKTT